DKLRQALAKEATAAQTEVKPRPELFAAGSSAVVGSLQERLNLIGELIARLSGRQIYSLVHKLRMSDFPGPHTPENVQIKKIVSIYQRPANRLAFVTGLEALCRLPRGSVVMYCPHDARMNAKIARVNL